MKELLKKMLAPVIPYLLLKQEINYKKKSDYLDGTPFSCTYDLDLELCKSIKEAANEDQATRLVNFYILRGAKKIDMNDKIERISALGLALKKGYFTLAKQLVEIEKANPNCKATLSNDNLLHYFLREFKFYCIKLGAQYSTEYYINKINITIRAIEFLLKHGADKDALDYKGTLPLDVIKEIRSNTNETTFLKMQSCFQRLEKNLSVNNNNQNIIADSNAKQPVETNNSNINIVEKEPEKRHCRIM